MRSPNRPNETDSPPASVTWDETHLKALLSLRRHPGQMLREEPWRTWLEQRGGPKRVIEHLRAAALSANQQRLLELILAHPGASSIFYAGKLHLTQSPYYARLSDLVEVLLIQLNRWTLLEPADFPSAPTNLPSALTPLVGADENLATVAAVIRRPGVRLLTLTGPGGVGKTRLALATGSHLLADFKDGVFFVPLEAVNDPALLLTQVVRALNIETGTQPLLDVLKAYLHERQILLILDNFEQLIDGRQLVADLLQAAGQLKVLVTSREPLNLYGENRFTVPELTWPDPRHLPPLEQLSRWPAVDLFVQRVQARHPAFVITETNKQAVIGICNRLDGLPLAIELAAAQVKSLPADRSLPQLERGLKSLRDHSRDRPTRQKTLWDAIDWSYRLLTDAEKALFRRLAVFGREWGLEAAQAVCQMEKDPSTGSGQALLTGLEELADKSLLRYAEQGEDGALRFQMLQPIRAYALEQLANSAETEQTQYRHASHFLEMVERAEPAIGTPEQLRWVRRIRQERENLQIALQWMLDNQETEMAFKLLGAVWRYYNMLNIWDETKSWMDRALTQETHLTPALAGGARESVARAKTLWGAYWFTARLGDHLNALPLAEEGLRIAREHKDQRLAGLLLQCMVGEFCHRNKFDEALQAAEESLRIFRALDDPLETAWALGHLSRISSQRGDLAKGQEILKESLSIFRAIGDDWALEHVLRDLSMLLWRQGELEQVKAALEESLRLAEKLGEKMGIGWTLNLQGRLALEQSDFVAARALFEKAQGIFQQIGDQTALVNNLEHLKRLELIEKDILRDT